MNELATKRLTAMQQMVTLLSPFAMDEIPNVVRAAVGILELAKAVQPEIVETPKQRHNRVYNQKTNWTVAPGPDYSLEEAAEVTKTTSQAIRMAAKRGAITITQRSPLRLNATSVRKYAARMVEWRKAHPKAVATWEAKRKRKE